MTAGTTPASRAESDGCEQHPQADRAACQHPQACPGPDGGAGGRRKQHPQAAPTSWRGPGARRTSGPRTGLPCPQELAGRVIGETVPPGPGVLRPLARALLAAAADLHAPRRSLPGTGAGSGPATTGTSGRGGSGGLRMPAGGRVSVVVSPVVSPVVCAATVDPTGCATVNTQLTPVHRPLDADPDSLGSWV